MSYADYLELFPELGPKQNFEGNKIFLEKEEQKLGILLLPGFKITLMLELKGEYSNGIKSNKVTFKFSPDHVSPLTVDYRYEALPGGLQVSLQGTGITFNSSLVGQKL